ncbi:MAG: PHP-associated domain-containing protein [Sphaerochaeta sp.]|nr:PHP-associated domain-containing protein [Sphaerochaeta sp.]
MRREGFLYETHLHTEEASACAQSWAKDYIKPYKEAGYSGIIVTDHFFNGNTNIPSSLGWEERVSLLCRGFEHAKEEGDLQGLSVFFGFEAAYGDDEYLIYGLDKQWLLSHPQIMDWSREQLFKEVERMGGCMIQAHPFRERDYLDSIILYPHLVHGIEVGNNENDAEHDRKAFAYAQAHDLSMSCGNDIHHVSKIGSATMGVVFDTPLRSIDDFITAIKQKENTLFMPPEHRETPFDRQAKLPIFLYDKQNKARKIEAWEAWGKGT